MACLKFPHWECPHSSSVLWNGQQSQGHLQSFYRLGTLQNPKLRQFILRGSLPLCPIYENESVLLRMYLSSRESHETLKLRQFISHDLSFVFPQRDDHCPGATNKPMKQRCKINGCNTNQFKTIVHGKNAIVHTHQQPFQRQFAELYM